MKVLRVGELHVTEDNWITFEGFHFGADPHDDPAKFPLVRLWEIALDAWLERLWERSRRTWEPV